MWKSESESIWNQQNENLWSEGTINIPDPDDLSNDDTICHYWVKHYEEPSEIFGIDGGRISKLTIKVDGQVTCHYDRGWDMEPEDEATQLAYWIVMDKYN